MLTRNDLLQRLHQARNEWQDAHILEQLEAQANVDLSPPLPLVAVCSGWDSQYKYEFNLKEDCY